METPAPIKTDAVSRTLLPARIRWGRHRRLPLCAGPPVVGKEQSARKKLPDRIDATELEHHPHRTIALPSGTRKTQAELALPGDLTTYHAYHLVIVLAAQVALVKERGPEVLGSDGKVYDVLVIRSPRTLSVTGEFLGLLSR